MRTTRRQFLEIATATGVASLIPWRRAYAFSQSPQLRKFIQPLRGVSLPPYSSPGIPVALPDLHSTRAVDHYTLVAGQYTDQLHPDLAPTTLWGYADAAHGGVHRHLGGVIVAQKNRPVQFTMTNNLPSSHILPVDTGLPGANQAQNRMAVHLHGGFIPWISDGGPHDWFAPDGTHGLSFLNNSVNYPVRVTWGPGQAEYFYPNQQSARMMWYHDHAWGITRLNAYAGIATAYLIRDPHGIEGQLISQGLPGYIEAGGAEVPLVIQDKIFWDPGADPLYSNSVTGAQPGSLWYAYQYERTRWRFNPANLVMPVPSCIPEFFGDTMLVNGAVSPFALVEPRRYRFRILNACQAKFLNLQLFIKDGSPDGITLNKKGAATNAPGPTITVIGAEGGFLPAPVVVNNPPLPFNPATCSGNLIVGPAERIDCVIDFSGLDAGTKVILYTDAPSPFPVGDPRNDYYFGSSNPTITAPGYAPDTRQLLQFEVGVATGKDPALNLAGLAPEPALLWNKPGVVPAAMADPGTNPFGANVRMLTLNEAFDTHGRLIQMLGTDVAPAPGGFGRAYMDTPTEVIPAGSTEVWQIANLTGDTHPIHFHLVNVQILARQPFKVNQFNGVPNYVGPARAPEPYEQGWKETVRMNPGEVTTVVMKFDLPTVPFKVPVSARTGGNEYVWHCHILEHEEHDMMRPLIVT
jgi:FtsP/CotA-like multicopper oxidase with cupredoxin domain